jgi:hypothetical protein
MDSGGGNRGGGDKAQPAGQRCRLQQARVHDSIAIAHGSVTRLKTMTVILLGIAF